jgi:hypothetical protein
MISMKNHRRLRFFSFIFSGGRGDKKRIARNIFLDKPELRGHMHRANEDMRIILKWKVNYMRMYGLDDNVVLE